MLHTPRVLIFYKTKSPPGHNHYHAGGLAANALHTHAVLRETGVSPDVVAVQNFQQIVDRVRRENVGLALANRRVTHVIIEAVWVEPYEVETLAKEFPLTNVIVRAHSKMGFLQVEPEAIPVMRSIIKLHYQYPNLWFSSNNEEFCQALTEAYGPVVYLPNLYDVSSSPKKVDRKETQFLNLASFGATRLLKMHPTAALAAAQVAKRTDMWLRFHINVDSTPGGESVKRSVKNILDENLKYYLREVTWQDSETFRETIARMDLVFQLSATETFCMVAADAVSSGVPVVTGPAIAWVPKKYQVDIDRTCDAADKAYEILKNPEKAVADQQKALKDFVKEAKKVWTNFLDPRKEKKRSFPWWIF